MATAVSIAMATYNGERFLGAQLQSFLDQERQPDELVVCDDGSTDSTVTILEEFAAEAPFAVHLHRNPERLNFSRNFERAVLLCRGEIIFLSDQDDVWFPQKICTVCEVFERKPESQAVLNGQVITDAELGHQNVTLLDNMRALGMEPDQLIAGCATALRRQWAEMLLPLPAAADALFEGGHLTYDRWINQLSVLLGVRGLVETPLQYFRRYGSNASEHALHNPKGISRSELLADRQASAPTDAWTRRIEVLDLYEQWIGANSSELRQLGAHVDAALSAIARERESFAARIALASRSFLGRATAAAKLWSAGGYGYFNGWKSALNDVARAPAPTGNR